MFGRLREPCRPAAAGLRVALGGLLLALAPSWSVAAGGAGGAQLSMKVELNNQASLQRGARVFRNYCLSCHSASYMRYSRLGKDLGLTEKVLLKNFIFDPAQKVGDTMTVAMDKANSKRYFGVAAPDLSVIARSRGADWLYTYFKTFYLDPQRPFGVNNLAFQNVSMPHVLWELQGVQRAIYDAEDGQQGQRRIVGFELASPGTQNEEEYDRTVRDLVNFLVYLGEPVKLKRFHIGIWVMLYLLLLLGVVWLLKREYWKDVPR